MTVKEMETLSDEELFQISLKKNKLGNHTAAANRAMRIRRERSGHWDGIPSKPPTYEQMLAEENGYEYVED